VQSRIAAGTSPSLTLYIDDPEYCIVLYPFGEQQVLLCSSSTVSYTDV